MSIYAFSTQCLFSIATTPFFSIFHYCTQLCAFLLFKFAKNLVTSLKIDRHFPRNFLESIFHSTLQFLLIPYDTTF